MRMCTQSPCRLWQVGQCLHSKHRQTADKTSLTLFSDNFRLTSEYSTIINRHTIPGWLNLHCDVWKLSHPLYRLLPYSFKHTDYSHSHSDTQTTSLRHTDYSYYQSDPQTTPILIQIQEPLSFSHSTNRLLPFSLKLTYTSHAPTDPQTTLIF